MRLAPGVAIEDGHVVDRVRGLRLPANGTAGAVLRATSFDDAAARLRDLGADDPEHDVLAFRDALERHLLVNGGVLAGPVRTTVLRAVLPVAAALALLALPAALLVHAWPIAPAVGAGVLVHELAHAFALRGVAHAGVRRGLRAAVIHPRLSPRRALLVGAAGPLAPALAGLALVHVPTAALPLAAHALALTVVSPDGRNACGLS